MVIHVDVADTIHRQFLSSFLTLMLVEIDQFFCNLTIGLGYYRSNVRMSWIRSKFINLMTDFLSMISVFFYQYVFLVQLVSAYNLQLHDVSTRSISTRTSGGHVLIPLSSAMIPSNKMTKLTNVVHLPLFYNNKLKKKNVKNE